MKSILPALVTACAILCGCATPASPPVQSEHIERLSGVWRLPQEQGWVDLGPCPDAPDQLCGALTGFDGDPEARDFNHPDFWSWGERLCGAAVLQSATLDAEAGVWRGHVYWRAEGQILDAELTQTDDDTLEVLLFEGADLDEGVSMAVSTLLGSPPDPIDLTYYSVRAAIGRDALSQSQHWYRETPPANSLCTR